MIHHAVTTNEQLFHDKDIELQLDLLETPATVWADRDRMVQVMVNLLSNAAKFAPDQGGLVEIQLRQKGDFYRVSVADNGPGIPEPDLPIVFDKFRQSNASREKPVGTGLGLPICRQIIEHFGGRIWAEGQHKKGARLCFKLPVKAERPPD